jgi:hypothetical protein
MKKCFQICLQIQLAPLHHDRRGPGLRRLPLAVHHGTPSQMLLATSSARVVNPRFLSQMSLATSSARIFNPRFLSQMSLATSSARIFNPRFLSQMLLATSSARVFDPHSLSCMATYDVASDICEALHDGDA